MKPAELAFKEWLSDEIICCLHEDSRHKVSRETFATCLSEFLHGRFNRQMCCKYVLRRNGFSKQEARALVALNILLDELPSLNGYASQQSSYFFEFFKQVIPAQQVLLFDSVSELMAHLRKKSEELRRVELSKGSIARYREVLARRSKTQIVGYGEGRGIGGSDRLVVITEGKKETFKVARSTLFDFLTVFAGFKRVDMLIGVPKPGKPVFCVETDDGVFDIRIHPLTNCRVSAIKESFQE